MSAASVPPGAPSTPLDPDRSAVEAGGVARDSLAVALWTAVSRVSGVLRVAAIGAVLGPTFFGNTFQFTNSLPNLVYYGFLAGSLLSSLLVPALVTPLDAGDRSAAERISGGFLGVALVALVLVAPLAVGLGPVLLRLSAAGGGAGAAGAEQERVARLLLVLVLPQVFCYAVVATCCAIMNARHRFALPAAAPALENLGTLVVLGAVAQLFGTSPRLDEVGTGELLLLGLGSTAAVVLHGGVQWVGARRSGVTLRPRRGWRDPDVGLVVRRALPALAQAGLVALQTLVVLLVANRVAGGVVAFQIALNCYYLPIAIGAAPVVLALLPRLSRLFLADDLVGFRRTLAQGFGLAALLPVPAAVGCAVLAFPVARAVSFGQLHTEVGTRMLAVSLLGLALGIAGQSAFLLATYAWYARKDSRTPTRATLLQTAICLLLAAAATRLHGTAVLLVLGLAVSLANAVSAWHLTRQLFRALPGAGDAPLRAPLPTVAAAAVMALPAWLAATLVPGWVGGHFGQVLGVAAATALGAAVFFALHVAWRTREAGWLLAGLRLRARTAAASGGWHD